MVNLIPALGYRTRYAATAHMNQMRFFNDVLFANGQSHAAYAKYVSSLPSGFPDTILRINRGMLPDAFFVDPASAIDLHDARISVVASTEHTLRLILNVDHNHAYSQVTLDYAGVSTFCGLSDVLLQSVSEADLMCHETTVLDSGKFNHKMLFASSDILSVDFQSLGVQLSKIES
jgi:hypothetical protein